MPSLFCRENCCQKPATYNHWEYALAKKLLDKSLARDQSGKHSSAFSHGGPVPAARLELGPLIADPAQGAKMTLVEQLRSKKKALTVEELAGILCIAIRTLYKEVEDDHIPFFRVRTSIRFDPHQIADWLEGKMPSHSVSPPHRPDAGLRA